MIIRKFSAQSLPGALAKMRAELGDLAIILKTRIDYSSLDTNHVVITAAVDCEKITSRGAVDCSNDTLIPQNFVRGCEYGSLRDPDQSISNQANSSTPDHSAFAGVIEVIGW